MVVCTTIIWNYVIYKHKRCLISCLILKQLASWCRVHIKIFIQGPPIMSLCINRWLNPCSSRLCKKKQQQFLSIFFTALLEYEQILYIRRANICLYNFQINFILSNLNQTCNEARDEHFTGSDHHSLYIWTSIGLSIQSESKYLLNIILFP